MSNYSKDITILYVEDDKDAQEGYIRALSKICSTLYVANNGVEGLEIFKKERPDIVISDINMPKKSGIEMAKEIKEIDKEQAIIFTTAHVDSKYTLEALALHVEGYFVKPINKKELKSKIEKIKKHILTERESKETKEILQNILDNQTSITILTDFETIKFASKSFFKLFNIENQDSFFEIYENLLDIFIKHPRYLSAKTKEEFLKRYENSSDEYRVVSIATASMEAKAFYIEIDKLNDLYILTLTDITNIQIERLSAKYKATHDELTSVYNRVKFEEYLELKYKDFKRYQRELSLAILDIDYFKHINDTYGHLTGDKILKDIAHIAVSNLRESDLFARWGGEEFVILFSETDKNRASIACEKLRKKIEETKFDKEINVTVSFGVTQITKEDTIESLFKRADEALYRAKQNGRNRVEII